MKKSIALLLALVMCFSIAFSSFAEEETEITRINWSDYEDRLAEAGWEGRFNDIGKSGLVVWAPDIMQEIELTEEYTEKGYVLGLLSEYNNFSLAVTMVAVEGITMESYAEFALENGAVNLDVAMINTIPMIGYTFTTSDGTTAYVVAIVVEGIVMEFSFTYTDERYDSICSAMISSIMISPDKQ